MGRHLERARPRDRHFAQTEVDQRLVNLTRFPLFFPEKRDFFLDGSTFFRPEQMTGVVQPFFSRRIGLDEGGAPQKIDLGAKLTGQAGAPDVGFLHVRSAEDGVAAGEDFSVLRVKRRILAQSYIGAFLSQRHARGDGRPGDRLTAGLDAHLETSRFRGNGNLELSGFFLWNSNPLKTGDNRAYGAQVDYPNDRWNARFTFTEVQPNVNPAAGFTRRRGFRGYNSNVRFAPRPGGHPLVRQLTFSSANDIKTGMDNRLLTRVVDITAYSGWSPTPSSVRGSTWSTPPSSIR